MLPTFLVGTFALAQAAPDGGPDTLTLILVSLIGGGLLRELVTWARDRREAEPKGSDVLADVVTKLSKSLQDARQELEDERKARIALEATVEAQDRRLKDVESAATVARHREREELMRSLLAAIPDAIIQAGHDGKILHINDAALVLLGYDDAKELLGLPVTVLIPDRNKARHREAFEAAIVTGHGRLLDSDEPIITEASRRDGVEVKIALRLGTDGHTFTSVMRRWTEVRSPAPEG